MVKKKESYKARVMGIVEPSKQNEDFVIIVFSAMEFGGKPGFGNFKMKKCDDEKIGIYEGSVLDIVEDDEGNVYTAHITKELPVIRPEKKPNPDEYPYYTDDIS